MTTLKITLKAILASSLLLLFGNASAQDEGFIYGTIIMEDGDEYTGPIRWGKEEVYWTDMFNASKRENDNLDYLSNRELNDLEDRYYRRSGNSLVNRIVNITWDDDDNDNDFVHEFSTAFGNIKAMKFRSSDRVEIKLKNGENLRLDGSGYNDVGTSIRVMDEELGQVKLSWRDIDEIIFRSTPSRLEKKFGEPLYGTVEGDIGVFTGYVQWDHDERVSTDILDGEEDGNDYEIEFGKIKSIERDGFSSSIVTLNSGRDFDLRGTNDVDDDNKGIIVTVKGLGRVDMEWNDFDKVTFKEAPGSGRSYDSFDPPKMLSGTVKVDNGDVYEGTIVFDLDEELDIEVLNGEDDDTKFIIPFSNIKEIAPRGSSRSLVTLKSGDQLALEDSQDVAERNQGLLIKTNNDRVYVPWDRVDKISFE